MHVKEQCSNFPAGELVKRCFVLAQQDIAAN